MKHESQNLLAEIEAFAAETGLAETTLGRKAVNDGKLAARLRAGKRVWPETAERVRDFMRAERERRHSKGEAA